MDTQVIDQDSRTELGALVIPDVTLPGFVLGQARRRGAKPALVDVAAGRALSYAELADAVAKAGTGLAASGVRAGDVLALCAPNSIEFVVTWYAATSVGAIVATVNPQWTGDEISRQLRQSAARWLVTTTGLFEAKLNGPAAEAGIAATIVIGEPAPGTATFSSLLASAPDQAGPVCAADGVNAADVAFLPCSSGTTGLPKIVVLTHRNLVANLGQMRVAHRVTEDDVVLAALPLFHIYALQVSLNLSLAAGATVVIQPRFERATFLHTIGDYGVTRAEVVPPMVLALATAEPAGDYDLSSLRLLTSAAAPLSTDLARTCARRLGCQVKQLFGMTEVGGGTHIPPDGGPGGPRGPDRPESIGPALPGVECRVVDSGTGADLGPGEPGELLVRTPGMMTGYLGDPEATAATIDPAGWLHTGDIVIAGADGWYRITDRAKELIKYKGYSVAPAELEGVLLTHPAVADAAVVRNPDPVAGEVPKAFVVLRTPASAQDLMTWVAERVAPYKRVRQVEFTGSIPRSPAGKILRWQLTEQTGGHEARTEP
jgi:acyl-CoA synthetase (AMP-forming)/AMP-acid ligase II